MKIGIPDFFPIEQPLQEALGSSPTAARPPASSRASRGPEVRQRHQRSDPHLLAQGREAYAQLGAGVPPAQAAGSTGHHFTVKQYGTTRVIHADQNKEYEPGPTSEGVPRYMQVVEATLRGVGKIWGLENWFGRRRQLRGRAGRGLGVRHAHRRPAEPAEGFAVLVATRVIQLADPPDGRPQAPPPR